MGTIVERTKADGSVVYVAQILLKQKGKIVFREGRTFARRPAAASWIETKEKELRKPGGIEAVQKAKAERQTLADAIDRYINENEKKIGRTKTQVLRTIKTYPIASMYCDEIKSEHIFDFAKALRQKVKPQTVGNYLSHLSSIFTIARPAWAIPLDEQAMKDAQLVGKKMGVLAKSGERDRRPELAELDKLLGHFALRSRLKPAAAPMVDLILFAIFSTRRQEEITRIAWADLDEEGSRVLVRDMKHPGEKIGNDRWCDLVPEALAVIKRQKRKKGGLIFPYNARTVSAAFTRACPILGVDDLHFHDLRHEGISRLAELGWSIPRMAAVSGHRSWNSLKRYTHIRKVGDKYQDWAWLPVVTDGQARQPK